jgi:TRAP-type C4-dicarboxylate transport system substrate-binding protein
MSSAQAPAIVRHLATRPWAALALITALMVAGCSSPGTGKAGGAPPEASPNGTITLTFASANLQPADTTFAALVSQDSGGHLRLRTVNSYDDRSTSVDQVIAADLQKGKLDVGDVGSRAWESLGVQAFRAYQDPFLVTSRELLDAAVTGRVAAGLLAALKPAGLTGLAIVPDSIRYLYSTRPLTTAAQFSGAKIRINVSDTTGEVLRSLGAIPVTDIQTGPPAVQALRDGALTAVESNPYSAVENGYVQVAPYVVVNVPLFAKTTTFAVNSATLASLPARDVGWLRQAAQQAAATEATSTTDRTSWGSQCGQGLKPLALTGQQLTALQNAEAPTYADLATDASTALAVDRIGRLATSEPRMDAWATCNGVGVAASPTKVLDGSYEVTITQAEVVASGDCTDCGNAGTSVVVIHDGRYYGAGVGAPIDANPNEPIVAFQKAWQPGDPSEVGTVSITGNQVTFVPETNQQWGSAPTTATFELFHGLLTFHLLSGPGNDGTRPWRKLS